MQHNRGPKQPSGRRDGVILTVVLSLLTLFAIVGISFQIYGETAGPELREFHVFAEATVEQAGIMTAFVGPDLREALQARPDFTDSLAAIDKMAERTAAFKAGVRAAIATETNSDRRADLVELCDNLEDLQFEVGLLRQLIEALRSEEGGIMKPAR